MSALYVVLPLALLIVGVAIVGYVWSVRTGQMDDLDTPASLPLRDDRPRERVKPGAGSSGEAPVGSRHLPVQGPGERTKPGA
jgi:cbb3-type cytochrome oxidase maturation protein